MREFLYVDDLADAILFMLENIDAKTIYEEGISHLNIGTGKDISINKLANLVSGIVGFAGDIMYDSSKPDGTPRKLMDVGRLTGLGWKYKTELRDGITATYKWFLENVNE